MGWLSDLFRSALGEAEGAVGPSSWREAVDSVYGGSTAAAAEAEGVTRRTMQRWLAGESGSGAQARRPDPSRLARTRERATLVHLSSGSTVVSYDFSGDLSLRAGGKAGRSGSLVTQSRDTNGLVQFDPDGLDSVIEKLLDDVEDDDELDRAISEAMFGPDSDYSIPPSPDYPAIVRISRFRLSIR